MSRLRLLDLFCGAGGAGMGYHRAGFDVVGVDIAPQPRYPFPFILGDSIEILAYMLEGWLYQASDGNWYGIDDFDAIHASPPCQGYTRARAFHDKQHPKLIKPVRDLLNKNGKPYVIENVPGAPMRADVVLCGSMFGLGYLDLSLYRHRLFELSGFSILLAPATCNHKNISISIFGHTVLGAAKNGQTYKHPNERQELGVAAGRVAMDIDWMTKAELSEAIPPAYTEYIGQQLMQVLKNGLR